MSAHWYDFDAQSESVNEARDRRLMQCPALGGTELEQLYQLRTVTYDGGLISKVARSNLHTMGLIVRFNGWQVVSKEGLAVLETLGKLKNG